MDLVGVDGGVMIDFIQSIDGQVHVVVEWVKDAPNVGVVHFASNNVAFSTRGGDSKFFARSNRGGEVGVRGDELFKLKSFFILVEIKFTASWRFDNSACELVNPFVVTEMAEGNRYWLVRREYNDSWCPPCRPSFDRDSALVSVGDTK